MFLVLLTVLLTDVDHWECLSENTNTRFLRFGVWWRMNHDRNGRWMGRGPRRPRSDSADPDLKKTFSRIAAAEPIWYPTRFPFFPVNRLPQDSSSCLTPLNDPVKLPSSNGGLSTDVG